MLLPLHPLVQLPLPLVHFPLPPLVHFPLPPLVHHAAGGVAYKAYCVGGIPAMNQNTAVLAACGAGGAILSGMILG